MARTKKVGLRTKKKVEFALQSVSSANTSGALTGKCQKVWQPGVDPLAEGEELQYEPSAYNMLHAFRLGWPCLSFDILRDELGALRHEFPHTMFCVAGTQAETPSDNVVMVAKVSNINGKKRNLNLLGSDDSSDSSDSSDDSDIDEDVNHRTPKLQVQMIAHRGGINRIRAMPQEPNIVATWSDAGHVQVWDIKNLLHSLSSGKENDSSFPRVTHKAPLKTFFGHGAEGFALDWSPVNPRWLASGDNNGVIHVWQPQPSNVWNVGAPFIGHSSSVEDLQWSPVNGYEFASCSSDGTLGFWDIRTHTRTLSMKIHDTDVNVISWNRSVSTLIASGGDDGVIKIWHRDRLQDGAVAYFKYHSAPITSIEWCPHEPSMFAAASADNMLSVWDLSVERDPEGEDDFEQSIAVPENLPPQLMFVHQGQKDLKELHWHPQILGTLVSTSFDNFNVFKPSNIEVGLKA